MKKIFSVLLALIILFSLSCIANAEEGDLFWEQVGPIVEDSFGENAHFVRLEEVDAKIWIPDYLEPVALSEEDLAGGAVASFMAKDESEMIYIVYTDVSGITLDAFQQQLTQNSISSKIINVNGIPVLLYYDSGTITAIYSTADGYFLQLIFYPASDEFLTISLASVQPDVEETGEAASVEPVNPVSGLIYK